MTLTRVAVKLFRSAYPSVLEPVNPVRRASTKTEIAGKSVMARNVAASSSPSKWLGISSGKFNWVDNVRTLPVDEGMGTFSDVEPRSGRVLAEVPVSGRREVDRAVKSALEAFRTWKNVPAGDRGRILVRAAGKIRDHAEEIALAETVDNGKPIWESRMDLETVVRALEYYGGLAPAILGQHAKVGGGSWAYVSREPLGVVAGIGAWNYPLQTCSWKLAPALACGNTMVYKPSEFAPLTAVILAEVLAECGLPPGVFNVVQGPGSTGSCMAEHPGFAKYSFTGSVSTGSNIMKAAANGIRHVTLELGGKSPLIIFDDADLKNAVKGALMANFFSQGQVCSNGTRVFVQEGILQDFLGEFVKRTKMLKVGDPLAEDTTVGATVSQQQAERVLGYLDVARDEGCKFECGGERVLLPGDCAGGHYMSPCILTNCNDEMTVVKEEIFGAVATVLSFKTEDEVIRRANDTPFGLAGGVFTRDLARAHRVCEALEAGTLWINTFNLAPPEVPFGGHKMSGIGRENGLASIEHYTQTKTVYVEMNDVDCGLLYKEDDVVP